MHRTPTPPCIQRVPVFVGKHNYFHYPFFFFYFSVLNWELRVSPWLPDFYSQLESDPWRPPPPSPFHLPLPPFPHSAVFPRFPITMTDMALWPSGKESASTAGNSGSDPRFPSSSHFSDLKIRPLVAVHYQAPGVVGSYMEWLDRCEYTATGEIASLIWSFCPSVAARIGVWTKLSLRYTLHIAEALDNQQLSLKRACSLDVVLQTKLFTCMVFSVLCCSNVHTQVLCSMEAHRVDFWLLMHWRRYYISS